MHVHLSNDLELWRIINYGCFTNTLNFCYNLIDGRSLVGLWVQHLLNEKFS